MVGNQQAAEHQAQHSRKTRRRANPKEKQGGNDDAQEVTEHQGQKHKQSTQSTQLTLENWDANLPQQSVNEYLDERHPLKPEIFNPSSKGTATWEGRQLNTADGWIICGGTITRDHYESVKGIDLIKYFTQNHLADKARAEESRKKKIPQAEEARQNPNPLQIPNPRLPRRGRNKNRKRKNHSPLLALPAELRNKIYSYVIADGRILIQGNHPNKELAVLKSYWINENTAVERPRYRLSHLLDNEDSEDGLEVSTALLLVCKKINKEVEWIMYSQLSFCFDSMNVVHKFMGLAPKDGVKAIKKLELHHTGYGYPKLASHWVFKSRHDTKWRLTCERIAREMPALESLRLDVAVHDWPVTLRQGDRWWRTLWRLIPNEPLNHVEVKLTHNLIGKERLARCARRLEDHMMNEKGKNERDEREANFLIQQFREKEAAELEKLRYLPPLQAKKVLKVVLGEISEGAAGTEVKKEQKKYYSSKTDGYARELPDLLCEW